MNYLSNKESRYRSKIIAENHLKKDGQQYLDQYVKRKLLTYKTLYLNYGFLHSMLTQYNLRKFGRVITSFGESCVKVASSMQVLAASIAQMGDYEKDRTLKKIIL